MTEHYKCDTCGYLYRKDAPCEFCTPNNPKWQARGNLVKTCCNCDRGPCACSRFDKTCQLESGWHPAGKWPSHEQRTSQPGTGLKPEVVVFDDFMDYGIGPPYWAAPNRKGHEPLTLKCLGGPKNGEVVELRGMAYRCITMEKGRSDFVYHEYVPENLDFGDGPAYFLVYKGEVGAGQKPTAEEGEPGLCTECCYQDRWTTDWPCNVCDVRDDDFFKPAGQKPARKGSKMQTTRVQYVMYVVEKRDEAGQVKREESIYHPAIGIAAIDMPMRSAQITDGVVREAVLEQHHERLAKAGLKYTDILVVSHPFV